MEENNSFENIKREAQKIEITPPQRSWYKLQRRLKKAESAGRRKTFNLNFIVSIAAIGLVLIASIAVLNIETRNMQNLPKGKIVEWETLDSEDVFFMDKGQIKGLYAAYAQQADPI
ncbi:MAG: hypothetical protein HKN09_00720 [Saprospiraceae bacterium]|nr:hypothetical protein [Saprospiraceae bacterium]